MTLAFDRCVLRAYYVLLAACCVLRIAYCVLLVELRILIRNEYGWSLDFVMQFLNCGTGTLRLFSLFVWDFIFYVFLITITQVPEFSKSIRICQKSLVYITGSNG